MKRRISILVMTREAEQRMMPSGDAPEAPGEGAALPLEPGSAPPAMASPGDTTEAPAPAAAPPLATASPRPFGLPDLQKLAEVPKPREEFGVPKPR
jgi:chemotaxis protein MotB